MYSGRFELSTNRHIMVCVGCYIKSQVRTSHTFNTSSLFAVAYVIFTASVWYSGEKRVERVQSERGGVWDTRMDWISHLFVPPLSSLVLPGAWCLASRVVSFHKDHCPPCIRLSLLTAVSVRAGQLRAWLCREWGRQREGSKAETLTWHRWGPPCQPAALCRSVHPKNSLGQVRTEREGELDYPCGSLSLIFSVSPSHFHLCLSHPESICAVFALPHGCWMSCLRETWGSQVAVPDFTRAECLLSILIQSQHPSNIN